MHNFGTQSQTITHHQQIAQLIFENAQSPRIQKVSTLKPTARNDKGYGSTDISPTIKQVIASSPTSLTPDMTLQFNLPYTISLSADPFDFKTHRVIQIHGKHPTLGLETYNCPIYKRPKLKQCQKSTPLARLQHWRSELRDAYILQTNNTIIRSKRDITKVIQECRKNNHENVKP